ncbi:MAG: rod shape-determining protein MreC [Faecalibacterium sp.]|nr:rod shape-determining protein MreC [Faecalibacterium sp.]
MRDFFESPRFKVLLAVAVFLAGMMAYAGANGRLTAAPQEILTVLAQPFQWVGAQISGAVGGLWEKYTAVDQAWEENERLAEENAALQQKLVEYDKLKAENDAFKKLAGIQEDHPEYTLASGFVIGRDTLEAFGGFTVDQGTLQGVQRGDTVISDDGYLVGTVIEAGLTSSKVLTILHPSFSAAGAISRTRDNGIITGSADYAAEGQCVVTSLTRDTLATNGDQIITTGLGGVYPADMLVGNIDRIEPDASGKSVMAVVDPGAEILSLTHVFIITNF